MALKEVSSQIYSGSIEIKKFKMKSLIPKSPAPIQLVLGLIKKQQTNNSKKAKSARGLAKTKTNKINQRTKA